MKEHAYFEGVFVTTGQPLKSLEPCQHAGLDPNSQALPCYRLLHFFGRDFDVLLCF